MKTTMKELEDKILVTLEGELDTVAAAEVNETLQPLYTSTNKDVVIDCKGLEYIASSGLRILVSIVKGAKASGCQVMLSNVNDGIMDVLRMTGFTGLFKFA